MDSLLVDQHSDQHVIQESLARVVAPNTVEIVAPPHAAGVAYFWLVCKDDKKNSLNSGDTSLTRSDLLYTNAVPFYFTPADVEGTTINRITCWCFPLTHFTRSAVTGIHS